MAESSSRLNGNSNSKTATDYTDASRTDYTDEERYWPQFRVDSHPQEPSNLHRFYVFTSPDHPITRSPDLL